MASSQDLTLLGIESSCDETAAAVVAYSRDENGDVQGKILSNIVRSQVAEHADFGGVVPELAARAHVVHMDQIIHRTMAEAGMDFKQLDGIAATGGPGLIGGVLVGLTTAKALCVALDRPLIGVNHLEGHALTARLTDKVEFPYLLLLVSGGHTQFLLVKGVGDYALWGTSIDDALGEAFDKVAKMLGLEYPGGPQVERQATLGDPQKFNFPRPLLKRKNLDFLFRVLKLLCGLLLKKLPRSVIRMCAIFVRVFSKVLLILLQNVLKMRWIGFRLNIQINSQCWLWQGGWLPTRPLGWF